MNLSFAILIIVVFLNIILGVSVLLRNSKKITSILFGLIVFGTTIWMLSNYLVEVTSVPLVVNQISNIIAYISAFISLSIIYIFTLVFSDIKENKAYKVLAATLFLIIAPLAVTPLIAGEVERSEGLITISNGPLIPVYSLGFLALLIIVARRFVQIIKKNPIESPIRAQARLMLFGFSVSSIGGLVMSTFIPYITGDFTTAKFGPLFMIFLISCLALAIFRYKLFDVRLVVARSLGYLLSVALLGIIYGVLAFSVIEAFVFNVDTSKIAQQSVYTLLAVGLAFTFQPLKKFFDKWTNRVFYRDAYDPQALIDELNQALVSTMNLNQMLKASSEIIEKHIKPEFCLFGLKETEHEEQRIIGNTSHKFSEKDIDFAKVIIPQFHHKVIVADRLEELNKEVQTRMRKNDIAVIVRLTSDVDHEGIGVIVLGVKRSGGSYNSQDLKVLEIIANTMVIAIENALKFEEIQKFNISLEQKVESATRRLRHTNEKLQALDETKDEFISMASHQLRTPLTSIKGYVSMVIEGDAGELNAQQKKLLGQAFISSQRMVYLISDLLNVSRLRTGKFVIEKSQVDLAELVAGEVDQLKDTAKARGLKLIYKKPKDIPIMDLDETKIRQVVMNFMDNAIYYSGQGKEILVELEAKPRSLEFRVNDQGIGVPKNHQHQLFSKFYRAENAKRARPDGTGLGLFMAKKVIIAQGGAIIFRSTEGKGSTFGFTFPLPAKKI